MKKALYCGIDLHSTNGMYVITDRRDKIVLKKRMPNSLPKILSTLEPYRKQLVTVVVESTYNWYWLVDGLMEAGYPVKLANPAAIEQYNGIKQANDLTDAAFLAHLARLDILPTGYIYPKEERPVRDLLRRRTLLVRQRTALILSLQNLFTRQAALNLSWRKIRKLTRPQRMDALNDQDYLLFVTAAQVELIEQFNTHIDQFEKKVLERAKLKAAYEPLLSIPGVGVILGLTIMLETGDITRFLKVGNFTSYCRCSEPREYPMVNRKERTTARMAIRTWHGRLSKSCTMPFGPAPRPSDSMIGRNRNEMALWQQKPWLPNGARLHTML
jgi:transposase